MQFGVHENLLEMNHLLYLLGDDIVQAEKPCLKQMIEQYERYNASILGVQTVPEDEVSRYGIVDG